VTLHTGDTSSAYMFHETICEVTQPSDRRVRDTNGSGATKLQFY